MRDALGGLVYEEKFICSKVVCKFLSPYYYFRFVGFFHCMFPIAETDSYHVTLALPSFLFLFVTAQAPRATDARRHARVPRRCRPSVGSTVTREKDWTAAGN